MKLYVGSRNYKPHGYKTVDIDASMNPDIVADVRNMDTVSDGSAEELVAGHVLEHIDWPDSFLALSEFSRVLQIGGTLRIAIPDMASLLRMLLSGDSAFHVMGLIYGLGGRTNRWEQHRYGFTPGMMVDILETLGFANFNWWNSPFGDASNGWVPRASNINVAMSLNIEAVKTRQPTVDTKALYDRLLAHSMADFLDVAADVRTGDADFTTDNAVPKLYQRIHFQLIEANQRILHLENELERQAHRPSE